MNGRMSIAEYKQLPARASKYGNKRCMLDGYGFDSLLELERYKQLKLMKAAGEIRGFAMQTSFRLFVDTYRVDFLVTGRDGTTWAEDVKGYATRAFIRKQREFEMLYPHIPLRILKG